MGIQQRKEIARAGWQARRAQVEGDVARVRFFKRWADRAIRLDDNPSEARKAYDRAYRNFDPRHPV